MHDALNEARKRSAAGDKGDFLIEIDLGRVVMNDLEIAAVLYNEIGSDGSPSRPIRIAAPPRGNLIPRAEALVTMKASEKVYLTFPTPQLVVEWSNELDQPSWPPVPDLEEFENQLKPYRLEGARFSYPTYDKAEPQPSFARRLLAFVWSQLRQRRPKSFFEAWGP